MEGLCVAFVFKLQRYACEIGLEEAVLLLKAAILVELHGHHLDLGLLQHGPFR